MLNVDGSLIIQIANFLVLAIVLNLILYRPIRGIISKRNAQFESLSKEIFTYSELATQRDREIQETISSARKEGALTKEGLRKEGSLEEERIIKETNLGIQERLKKTREELEKGILRTKEGLEAQVSQYAMELAERILGRSLAGGENG